MKTKIFFILIFNLLIFNLQSFSNNIQVNSATLTGQVPASNYTFVQFNLTWDNSWRDGINWDAAWVFVKYRTSIDTTWKHASLNTASGNHTIPGGFTGSPTSGGLGIFIHRTAIGNGNVNLSAVQLRWEYGLNGVNDADLVTVKVFAIEMVYIPQGSFYAGDGTGNNIAGQFSQGNTTLPFLITNEGALTLGGAPLTNLGNRDGVGSSGDDFNNTTTQSLPAAFPKGYNDFYCMKYETSQGQYTEFLNTLTRFQQQSRVQTNISTDVITNVFVMTNTSTNTQRNKIVCPGSGNGTTAPIVFSCDRQDRACSFLTWMDGAAYLDWSGLRPMTELEFEKVCRGSLTPVADEYAWGTNVNTNAVNISGTENGTETITTANANSNLSNGSFSGGDGGSGPLRCGIFATLTSTRVLSGSSFFGVMEMTGNVIEQIVPVGHVLGRTFSGVHGDGYLSVLGNGNVSNWPGLNLGEISTAGGSNTRGGNVNFTTQKGRISDRSSLNIGGRNGNNGCRGVRTSEVGTLHPQQNNNKN